MSKLSLSRVALLVLCVCGAAVAWAQPPVKIIFDTDIAGDVDDVGSLAMLHALADRGEAEILACTISSNNPKSAACVDAINTWYGRPDIPIGGVDVPVAGKAFEKLVGSRYTRQIASEFPQDLSEKRQLPSAVKVYRQVLAAQPDDSVTIVSVGFLTNLAELLDSPADEFSSLDGKQLVAAKVKQWVCMGGVFPEGHFASGEGEYNLKITPEATQRAINGWPTPIVFSGYEIGERVLTGAGLERAAADSPVRRGYQLYNGLGDRNSWDQTAVLHAVRGAGDYWELSPPGVCQVPEDSAGCHEWSESPEGKHRYLIEKMPPAEVAAEIETLMMAEPANSDGK
ncbi:nucleoside hydrolase [Aeoliella sp. ICT_H6.2]|uniref:Nucleoside hydrolase n=1 Tax=Aeoliella straminimaris TaxID=2954799 RepID=A0A9X2JFA5_9BACT|nr:nucleoside hydrolase [Aeoliella straminimaris]MCO6043481.1 nucleoside hydrolase [Aeoliella straminimaris]